MKHLGWVLGTIFSIKIILLQVALSWEGFTRIFGFTILLSFAFGTIVYRIFRKTHNHREIAVKRTSIFSAAMLLIPILIKFDNISFIARPSFATIIFTSVCFLVIPIIAMLHEEHRIKYKKSIKAAENVKNEK